MSLHPHTIDPIPEQTARIARAAFRRGNPFMRMRDEIGTLFTDEAFAPVFPARGRSVVSPWRLALVCVMQYVEGRSDRQAAEAVRARIDWKYALSLALDDPGFAASVLAEFRTRLVCGGLEQRMLDLMLDHFRAHKLLKARGKQRTDSTHVLAAIRSVNHLECVGETMRAALNSLAVAAPDWLRAHSDPQWIDRYGPRVDDSRLPEKPEARRELATAIAADGYRLMEAIDAPDAPAWLREVPAVQTLRRVWIDRFSRADERVVERGEEQGRPPSAGMISSPYDPDARYATKRMT
jgi:transposase